MGWASTWNRRSLWSGKAAGNSQPGGGGYADVEKEYATEEEAPHHRL